MGTIRNANPEYVEDGINGIKTMSPAAFFGFNDWPKDADILLDDIHETVLIKHPTQGIDFFTYDEFDKLKENGLRGARIGRFLRGSK